MPKGIGYPSEPKTWKLPSREYGITADDAAKALIAAEEIKANKPLLKAAKAKLKSMKNAADKALE